MGIQETAQWLEISLGEEPTPGVQSRFESYIQ